MSATPLYGVGALGKVRAVRSLVRGAARARALLCAHRAEIVIGLGGYTSAGAVLAARSLGVGSVIHEANVVPGRTNRFLARFVDCVALGFGAASPAFSNARTRLTGVPVRADIVRLAREAPALPAPGARPVRVLVAGGSRGSLFFDLNAPEMLAGVMARGVGIEVLHQADPSGLARAEAGYARLGVSARVERFIGDMSGAYRWADFALTRAGASTIAELALAGLPALLVPLPTASDDHQTPNAVEAVRMGGACWIREMEWEASPVADRVFDLLSSGEKWRAASRLARGRAFPHAAAAVVAACEAVLTAR